MIEAGQIYFIPEAEVRRADYGGPCLVLRVSKDDATICYFSTKLEYRQLHEVVIEKTDPDFKATGLRDSSYILNSPTGDVKLEFLKNAKLLGRATGDFKKRVEVWYGMPLN